MKNAHQHDEVTAVIEWPRPLSAQALKTIKTVLLGVLVVTALVQIVPFQMLGGLANHLFTILLILSWAGPARRFFRQRADRSSTDRSSTGGSSTDESNTDGPNGERRDGPSEDR